MKLARPGERTLADVAGLTTEQTLAAALVALGDLGYDVRRGIDPDKPESGERLVVVDREDVAEDAERARKGEAGE